jgi:hypothetical protein
MFGRGKKPPRVQPVVVVPTSNPDHAWRALDLVNGWISHAETKAGASLAASGVVGGVLYHLMAGRKHSPWHLDVLATLCTVTVILAACCAGVSLWPRLKGLGDPTSALYFSHIARGHEKADTYTEVLRLLTQDPEALTEQIAQQVWANAGVAHKKYHWTGYSLICLLVAVGSLGLVTLDIAIKSL